MTFTKTSSLKNLLLPLLALSALATPARAQTSTTQNPNRIDGYGAPVGPMVPVSRAAGETTIDIVGAYYQQTGSHGAVEGGLGTQQLTDVSPAIIVNVPLDTVSRLSVNVGADFYASASTDRIDFALSTPSAHDVRIHGDFGYSREQKAKGTIWGVGLGVSKEYDYLSFSAAASFAKTSRDGNRQLSVAGQVFLDQVTLITPIELRTYSGVTRGKSAYGTDTRQTYNFSVTTWIAHGAGSADRETVDKLDHVPVPPDNPSYTLRRVWLTQEEEQGYYYGFANEGMWPLCHIAHVRPVFRSSDWEQYVNVNRRFADAVIAEAKTDNPVVLVQDYHFALLPRMVREALPKATIITFWHIPWPNSESWSAANTAKTGNGRGSNTR